MPCPSWACRLCELGLLQPNLDRAYPDPVFAGCKIIDLSRPSSNERSSPCLRRSCRDKSEATDPDLSLLPLRHGTDATAVPVAGADAAAAAAGSRDGRARGYAGVCGGVGGGAAALPPRARAPGRRPLPPVLPPEYGPPTRRFSPLLYPCRLAFDPRGGVAAVSRGVCSVHGAVARQVFVVLPARFG